MPNRMKMLGGMLVLRGIATAHIAAFQAQSEVHPSVSEFDALFANMLLGVCDFDLIEMSASFGHDVLRPA